MYLKPMKCARSSIMLKKDTNSIATYFMEFKKMYAIAIKY